jgi:hypothetical protein
MTEKKEQKTNGKKHPGGRPRILNNKDDRLKRWAAKDVINFVIRHKEIEDLDKRLAAIEQRLDSQR